MKQRITFKRTQLVTYEFDTPDGVSNATAHGWANSGLFQSPGFQRPIVDDLGQWLVVRAMPEHCADVYALRQMAVPTKRGGKGR